METWFLQVVATKVPEGDEPEAALARLRKQLAGCWKMMIPKTKWALFTGREGCYRYGLRSPANG